MLYKQANNTYKTKQKKKLTFSYKSWQNTHTQDRARTAILYIISVNVPEDYSLLQYTVVVDVQQDHSLKHCIQLLSTSNKNIPYYTQYAVTVNVQQNPSLL